MMNRTSLLTASFLLVLVPQCIFAGGPPWLCIPVDGVTERNAKACSQRLAEALEEKLWKAVSSRGEVQIRSFDSQHYAMFYLKESVRLSEIEAAFEGSDFSVPRDRLGLFGHVILELERHPTSSRKLMASLDRADLVAASKWDEQPATLRVTVDMPYPRAIERRNRQWFGWKTFQSNDFSSRSLRSNPPATAELLPDYEFFSNAAREHNAPLKDIIWSPRYACRPLGCVAIPTAKSKSDKAIVQK